MVNAGQSVSQVGQHSTQTTSLSTVPKLDQPVLNGFTHHKCYGAELILIWVVSVQSTPMNSVHEWRDAAVVMLLRASLYSLTTQFPAMRMCKPVQHHLTDDFTNQNASLQHESQVGREAITACNAELHGLDEKTLVHMLRTCSCVEDRRKIRLALRTLRRQTFMLEFAGRFDANLEEELREQLNSTSDVGVKRKIRSAIRELRSRRCQQKDIHVADLQSPLGNGIALVAAVNGVDVETVISPASYNTQTQDYVNRSDNIYRNGQLGILKPVSDYGSSVIEHSIAINNGTLVTSDVSPPLPYSRVASDTQTLRSESVTPQVCRSSTSSLFQDLNLLNGKSHIRTSGQEKHPDSTTFPDKYSLSHSDDVQGRESHTLNNTSIIGRDSDQESRIINCPSPDTVSVKETQQNKQIVHIKAFCRKRQSFEKTVTAKHLLEQSNISDELTLSNGNSYSVEGDHHDDDDDDELFFHEVTSVNGHHCESDIKNVKGLVNKDDNKMAAICTTSDHMILSDLGMNREISLSLSSTSTDCSELSALTEGSELSTSTESSEFFTCSDESPERSVEKTSEMNPLSDHNDNDIVDENHDESDINANPVLTRDKHEMLRRPSRADNEQAFSDLLNNFGLRNGSKLMNGSSKDCENGHLTDSLHNLAILENEQELMMVDSQSETVLPDGSAMNGIVHDENVKATVSADTDVIMISAEEEKNGFSAEQHPNEMTSKPSTHLTLDLTTGVSDDQAMTSGSAAMRIMLSPPPGRLLASEVGVEPCPATMTVHTDDDGSVTVTDVQQIDNGGQRTVVVKTRKSRTRTLTDHDEKDTMVTTTYDSPGGTKFEEVNKMKSHKKLTPKGSKYWKMETTRTRTVHSEDGTKVVEQDCLLESDNCSVTTGESWGDKTLSKVILNQEDKVSQIKLNFGAFENRNNVTRNTNRGQRSDIAGQCRSESGEITIVSKPRETIIVCSKSKDTSSNQERETIVERNEPGAITTSPTSMPFSQQPGEVTVIQPRKTIIVSSKHKTIDTDSTQESIMTTSNTVALTIASSDSELPSTYVHKTGERTVCDAFSDEGSSSSSRRVPLNVSSGYSSSNCTPGSSDDEVLGLTKRKPTGLPDIKMALSDQRVQEGQSVTLQCSAHDDPSLEVIWYIGIDRITECKNCSLMFDKGVARLLIKAPSLEDEGNYKCLFKNSLGMAETCCRLVVEGKKSKTQLPFFTSKLSDMTSLCVSKAQFECCVCGADSIQWRKAGSPLCVNDRIRQFYDGTCARLVINDVTGEDAGIYTCVAINAAGEAQTSCHYKVIDLLSGFLSGMKKNGHGQANHTEAITPTRMLHQFNDLNVFSPISTPDRTLLSDNGITTQSEQTNHNLPSPTLVSVKRSNSNRVSYSDLEKPRFPRVTGLVSLKRSQSERIKPDQSFNKSASPYRPSVRNLRQAFETSGSPPPLVEGNQRLKPSPLAGRLSPFPHTNRQDTEVSGETTNHSPHPHLPGYQDNCITMATDLQSIVSEDELYKRLNATDNFEERKKIRARLREVHEGEMRKLETAKIHTPTDMVKKKHELAEEEKRQKLLRFQERASQPTCEREDHNMDLSSKDVKARHALADAEKERKMQHFQVKAQQDKPTVQMTGFGGTQYGAPRPEELARCLGNQLRDTTTTMTNSSSGKITVKTESWTSKDSVIQKTETTQIWGAKKPEGARGAMAAFKQMDQANPPKPNSLGSITVAKKVATRMNAVEIKKELLNFCQSNTDTYQTVQITNFSSCWNTGMAFCALIHHFYPEAFDFTKLDPKQRRYNFTLAFDTAEKHADIAPLLDVEDMVKMKNPDWKCVFTYVQSIYRKLQSHERNKQMAPSQ